MLTCVLPNLIDEMKMNLRKEYDQFRTSIESPALYLGCSWDFSEKGFVSVSQRGMIQELANKRNLPHTSRAHTPTASYFFERTKDSVLLDDEGLSVLLESEGLSY